MQIKVREQSYRTELNINVAFDIIRAYGYSKLSDLQTIFSLSEDPTVDEVEAISSLAVYGIKEAMRVDGVKEDEIEREAPSLRDLNPLLLGDPSLIEGLVNELMEHLPGEEETGESESPSSSNKKKGSS
jgi:hypothetical protein